MRVPDAVAVDPEMLAAAAAHAEAHHRSLVESLGAADAAVSRALAGWIGRSRDALTARAAQWAAATEALCSPIDDLAAALRHSSIGFAESDRGHARAVATR